MNALVLRFALGLRVNALLIGACIPNPKRGQVMAAASSLKRKRE